MNEITINTTQNVNINFTAASVGHRIFGSIIDWIIKFAYIFAVSYLVFDLLNFNKVIEKFDPWSQMSIFIIIYFPVFIYSLVLESIFDGQTIGKKILKIKVVKIDGYGASFGEYLIRWLLRFIDNYIFMGIIGLISMVVNSKIQRLGDIAAGTAVIMLKNKITINNTILMDIGEAYIPTYSQVIKLSDNDIRIIKDSFQIAKTKSDMDTINKLRVKIEAVTGIKNQSGSASDFIKTVLKDYNFYTQNM